MFKSVTLINRILYLSAIAIISPILVGVLSMASLQESTNSLKSIVDIDSEKVKLAARIQQSLLEMHRAEKNIILAVTQAEMEEYEKNYSDAQAELKDRRDRLRNLVDDANKAI